MLSQQEILGILNTATGTTAYHSFSLFIDYPLATDGAIALAQAAECFWLLDIIGSHQVNKKLDRFFQVWELKVDRAKKSGVVRGFNDTKLIVRQEIEYTNFPLDEITLWIEDGIILLPSEH